MAELASVERHEASHASPTVGPDEEEAASGIMLAPELMVPEEFTRVRRSASEVADSGQRSVLPRMIRLDGRSPGMYLIDPQCSTIGRGQEADICIDEACISRLHARLLRDGAVIVIEDAGSRNGVKVNSTRIQRQQLQDGDIIGLGRLRLQFIDPSEAPLVEEAE
jgi:hypothetical protein